MSANMMDITFIVINLVVVGFFGYLIWKLFKLLTDINKKL